MRATDSSVWTIAMHRSVAVIVGVLWALFVARWWWPSEARRELTRGLSECVFSACHFYDRIFTSHPFCRS